MGQTKNFSDGPDKEIKELEDRAIKETIDNIGDDEKVFYVKKLDKKITISKYTNLTYFGYELFIGKMSIKEAKDEQDEQRIKHN